MRTGTGYFMDAVRLGVIAAALISASVWAQLPPIRAEVGYAAQVVTNRSWDFVDDDDHLPMWRLAAGTTFDLDVGIVDAQLAYLTGATSTPSQGLQPTLWMRGFELSGQYRWPLWKALQPYARVGVTWDWATLNFGSPNITQTSAVPGGLARLGAQTRIPVSARDRPAHLIFDVGVGYALRPAFNFDAMLPAEPANPPDDPIREAPLNMGRLSMSGISYAVTVALEI
jgi:hypothetical protein